MLSVWILTVSSLFLFPVFGLSASDLGSRPHEGGSYNDPSPQYRNRVRWLAKERPDHSYPDPIYFPSAATYSKVFIDHVHNGKLVPRFPVGSPRDLIRPRFVGPVGQPRRRPEKPDAKAALGRVDDGMKKNNDDAAKDIDKAHTDATKDIDNATAEEKRADEAVKKAEADLKAHPNEKESKLKLKLAKSSAYYEYQRGEMLRHNDVTKEQGSDFQSINNFKQQAMDLQKSEFNPDGTPKTKAQKAADQALAGFLKFLDIFMDVVSGIAMLFPGPGDLLSIGIRLGRVGEETARAVVDITKAAKTLSKPIKAAEDIRKALNLQPGPPIIKGVNGKKMADLQNDLIGKLISLTSKNVQATMKKEADTSKGVKMPPPPPPIGQHCKRVVGGPRMHCTYT